MQLIFFVVSMFFSLYALKAHENNKVGGTTSQLGNFDLLTSLECSIHQLSFGSWPKFPLNLVQFCESIWKLYVFLQLATPFATPPTSQLAWTQTHNLHAKFQPLREKTVAAKEWGSFVDRQSDPQSCWLQLKIKQSNISLPQNSSKEQRYSWKSNMTSIWFLIKQLFHSCATIPGTRQTHSLCAL